MEDLLHERKALVAGNNKLAYSIAICLLRANYEVVFLTNDSASAYVGIQQYIDDCETVKGKECGRHAVRIVKDIGLEGQFSIALLINEESAPHKTELIERLEYLLPDKCAIGINAESIPLRDIQAAAVRPERVIGLNWVFPAYTTFFLEIIANQVNNEEIVNALYSEAKQRWNKDPYIIRGERGIRASLFSAMIREAFNLVDNGYATIRDIDRACRNDAGSYLPFSGNFRYMDLMGTRSYAEVMKDLNRELSKEQMTPGFFNKIIGSGALGMEERSGFYQYEEGEVERWNELFDRFSYRIRDIICKYPFNYNKEPSADGNNNE
ncbi:MAG: 3-hydroxyacyl-CoA dehydrogenase [Chitinophagaceae bacterium]|nr:3-hydroxyacyl-CoA dehydrogenase [Chitinophagaceae bacterium]